MTTEVAQTLVDPVATLTSSVNHLTDALEAHKTNKGALVSTQEAEGRAEEALATAKSRTSVALSNSVVKKDSVVIAIDDVKANLNALRDLFA